MMKRCLVLCLVLQLIAPPLWASDRHRRLSVAFITDQQAGIPKDLKAWLERVKIKTTPLASSEKQETLEQRHAKGWELLNLAKEQYEDLKFSKALETIQEARRKADLKASQKLYFYEALIRFAQGKMSSARVALETYIVLGGPRASETYYPPQFIRLYERAKFGVSRRKKADIEITNHLPDGRQLRGTVDGRTFDSTPVRFSNLPIGQHFVRIEGDGLQPTEHFIILGDAGETLSPTLKPLPESVLAKALQTSEPALALMQEQAGTDGVLILKKKQLYLYNDGRQVMLEKFEATDASLKDNALAVRSLLAPHESTMLVSRPPDMHLASPALQTSTESTSKRWHQKWWVWTLIGVAATGAGGAAYMLGSGGGDSGTDTVQLSVTSK